MDIDPTKSKILIVDDSPTNVLLLEKLLRINHYENFRSLTDSRKVLKTYISYRPDLILLDLRMPFLDGFQVLEQLRAMADKDDTEYISVIVITAQNDQDTRLRALELGAKDYIEKPFNHTEVIMRIRNLLEIRLLHNQIKENNMFLVEKVRDRTEKFYLLQTELIDRLLRAAEFRDYNSGGHITRIGLYARELARALGLGYVQCELIKQASMMHDIGKIGIPDDILLKPGKLTADEWEIMKAHTVKGAEILKGSASEVINMAEEIALTHHEKWDGTGYPLGLKAEKIPLTGRITAVVDVFDALLSKRPYKEAWGIEEVVEEIKLGSGTHFDPEAAQMFLKNLPTFIEIKEQIND